MAFFGYQNENAFYRVAELECSRLERPVPPPSVMPLTLKEEIQIQDLPLEEIRRLPLRVFPYTFPHVYCAVNHQTMAPWLSPV